MYGPRDIREIVKELRDFLFFKVCQESQTLRKGPLTVVSSSVQILSLSLNRKGIREN